MKLFEYVIEHTERGECKCGLCVDVGNKPDPTGHTVDMVFFSVCALGKPTLEEFKELTKAHQGEFLEVDPFDGKDHNYINLGAWIGDQGRAMQYMGLGVLLGAFNLISPYTLFKTLDKEQARALAVGGFLMIVAKPLDSIPITFVENAETDPGL